MNTELESYPIGTHAQALGPALLQEIIATASDIALLVDPGGRIREVLRNPHHRSYGRLRHWVGEPLRRVLTSESVTKLDARLDEIARDGATVAAELNHTDKGTWEFPVRYSLHRLDEDGTLLLLGRDLRPIAEMQQRLVQAQLAMERDYEAQREAETRYRVVMEAVNDAVVVVSIGDGRILDLNTAAAHLFGGARAELTGASFVQEFAGHARGELLEQMTSRAVSDAASPLELQARRSHKALLAAPTVFRAGGERLLLCRLEEPADTGAGPVPDALSADLERLYREGIDGIVFIDADGVIRSANDAFVNLTDSAGAHALRGRSLGDFLSRGAVDLRVLIDNARRAGHLRHYATRLVTAYSAEIAADISATWLDSRTRPCLVLVIRDATRSDSFRAPAIPGTDESARSLMELVGSASLKEIVAETNDVVEKMCIETAVELTGNNRVAAAEMLGLSRQSLYVKLRKHGLLSRDGGTHARRSDDSGA